MPLLCSFLSVYDVLGRVVLVENLVLIRGNKKKKPNISECLNGIFFAELLTVCAREETSGGVANGPAFLIVQSYRLQL